MHVLLIGTTLYETGLAAVGTRREALDVLRKNTVDTDPDEFFFVILKTNGSMCRTT